MNKPHKHDIPRIVNQSDLFKESIRNNKHAIPLNAIWQLAEQLQACKSKFISKADSTGFLYGLLSNRLNEKLKSDPNTKVIVDQAQNLGEIFTAEESQRIQLDIVEYFDSLPRRYFVHFHLPNVLFPEQLDIQINKQINLKFDNHRKKTGLLGLTLLSDIEVEENTENKEQKEYSLSIYIHYIGHLGFHNFEKPFSIFKQIVYLGICHNLFSVNTNYVAYPSEAGSTGQTGGLFGLLSTALNPLSDYFVDQKTNEKTQITLARNENDYVRKIEINPKLSTDEVKQKISLFRESFCLLQEESSKSDKTKILSGLEWAFDSDIHENETFKFILKCIAIEAVLGDSDSEKSTLKLSNRCAYQLAKNHQEREDFLLKFPKLYKMRSRLVHGNRVSLDRDEKDQLYFADFLLRRIFMSELQMLRSK